MRAPYLQVRQREGRLLSDEAVRALPIVDAKSPYAQEWRWRRRSFERFRRYLLQRFGDKNLRILDLGCGNGWMSNRLAEQPNWQVLAIDVNEPELRQGERLFARSNLQFECNDVSNGGLPQAYFDVVVLAASVQYFPHLPSLFFLLQAALKQEGEIHILDSHFYKNKTQQQAARQRTSDYYTRLGVPEMADFYHHHLWEEVKKAGGINLNNRLTIKLLQKTGWHSPFPWLRIPPH